MINKIANVLCHIVVALALLYGAFLVIATNANIVEWSHG